jgi:hypothetical protein
MPTLAGGSRIDIKHKYYVYLHTNLLVIYIICMELRLELPITRLPMENPTSNPLTQSTSYKAKAQSLEDILLQLSTCTTRRSALKALAHSVYINQGVQKVLGKVIDVKGKAKRSYNSCAFCYVHLCMGWAAAC